MDDSQSVPLLGIDEFLKEVEEIQELNKSYDENLEKIQNIHRNLLKIGWNQKAREKETLELERLTSKNKEFQKDISEKIKIGWSRSFPSQTDSRVKDQQMTSLTEKIKETILKSKNQEIQFQDKLRKKLVQTIKITGVQLSEEEIEHRVNTNQIEEFCSGSILKDTEEARLTLEEINKRHDQFKQLEQDIQELTELFKQLGEYVALQGYKMDTIEQNVDDAAQSVERGVNLLKEARIYFDKAMAKKRILSIVGASILVLFLIIIIASSVPQASPEPESTTSSSRTPPTSTSSAIPEDSCPDTDPFCIG